MHPKMSQPTKDEVMNKLRGRYARAGQQHKGKLIDQAIDLFDCIHPANPLEEAEAGEVCGCD